MIVPLQLRHDPAADAAPSAWFLPGDSAERWLAELTRCGLAEVETRLFLVPRSISDRSLAGVLAVPAKATPSERRPAGVPCRLIAGRLYVPADAVLVPPVTEAELCVVCPLPVSFFHPAFGLSGFEAEAALRVWHLIEPPKEGVGDWNFARPGAAALPELLGIVLAEPPSREDIFGGAEQEIATDTPEDLPPLPDEPKDDRLRNTGRNLRRLFAEGLAGAMRHVPHTGSHRTWVNDLEDWANRQVQGVNEQLEQLRHKELHRLLHLLDTDPETGLRHAIPMNQFAHRGLAPPGGRLVPRSLDFDPRRIGGEPADFWPVSPDLQDLLRRRYREMADRELQLGRHRRAAYIYAELLGDLVSAANAFKQGRHFREAALLYEEQLRNPVEAARCLAEGGLLAEAIERYEKLGLWLEVADLQERLGNSAASEAAVRRAIHERLAQDDVLGAAKLLSERLHATDEALGLLLRAWPSSGQAVACTAEALQMLARLGRHEAALERVNRFGREPLAERLVLPLLTALGGVARDYPHAEVRHRAEDLSRLLIAGQLKQPGLGESDVAQLMQCLIRLAPHDRLVSRDANRHLADHRAALRRAHRSTPPLLPNDKPEVERRFELPIQLEWLALRSEWHWFYALGVTPRHLTLVRGIWDGEIQSVTWKCPATAVKNAALVFEPTGEQGRAVTLAMPGGIRLEPKLFPSTDQFFGQDCIAGMPPWLPAEDFPFSFGEEGVWSGHVASGRAILSCHDKRGRLQQTIDVTNDLLTGTTRLESTRLCLASLATGAAIALGNRLLVTRSDGVLARIELPGQAVGLLRTDPQPGPGVAVLLDRGAVMHWLGTPGLIELDLDLPSPLGAFVPGGPLVLVSGGTLLLLTVDDRGVQKVTHLLITGPRPVGVCATSGPGRFAVLSAQGEMTIYRVPR